MSRVALVTGATAGLGAEFARQLAARGHDLILVARNRARLEAAAKMLEQAYGCRVDILPADLTDRDDLATVERRLAETVRPVDVLVNNAGFGLATPFESSNVDDEQRMIDLLLSTPIRLTHAALRQQLPRRSGTVINVTSIAGLTLRGVYGAAKAGLISFSRWAHVQYRGRGVRVTTVIPGFVRTEFHDRMSVTPDAVPRFMWLSAERVVREALRGAGRGRAVVTPSKRYKVIAGVIRILPPGVTARGELTHPEEAGKNNH
ncbi:SDR family oxidoreductase [Cryobacterium sp. BB736]|uniref:SDR family NAD(P)-dependent oxidoreductase n=1 Tax=Cryobacterium sp. BB736 TaxID=2746963 RepID=UPI0018749046